VFTSQNPKIVSLISINKESSLINKNITQQQKFQVDKNVQNTDNIQEKVLKKLEYKVVDGKSKLIKFVNYYTQGILYTFEKIKENLLITMICFIFILYCVSFIISKDNYKHKNSELIFILGFGLIWFVLSLTPFLLYSGITIPPYVFVLPSIGLSFFSYGILSFIKKIINLNILQYLIKGIVSLFFISSFITQIGYYYGIKEEFSYWEKTVSLSQPHIDMLIKNRYIEINKINNKNNNHIFWIEKFIGARYLQHIIGNNIGTPIISSNEKVIKIKIP